MTVLDMRSGAVQKTIPLPLTGSIDRMLIDERRGRLYLLSTAQVVTVDTRALAITGTLSLPVAPPAPLFIRDAALDARSGTLYVLAAVSQTGPLFKGRLYIVKI